MNFQGKLCQLGVQYQSLTIKDWKLKLAYFLCKLVFKIPIIASIALVQCQLFKTFAITKQVAELINNSNQFIFLQIIFWSYVLLLLILSILRRMRKNKLILETFFLLFSTLQIVNNFGSYFLIRILTSNDIHFFYRIGSVLIFIVSQIFMVVTDKILISYQGTNDNHFLHHTNNKIFILNILEKISFYLIIFLNQISENQQNIHKIFYFVLLTIYGFKLCKFYFILVIQIREKYYIDEKSNLLQIFGTIVCFNILLIIQIYQIFVEQIIAQNLLGICFTIGLFAIASVYTYSKYKLNQLIFQELEDIIAKNETMIYLFALYKLWRQQRNQYQSSIISSFRKHHSFSCRNISCSCRQGEQQDEDQKNIKFLEIYFQHIFKYIQSHTKQIRVHIQILFFRLQLFEQFIIVDQKIKSLLKQKISDVSTIIGLRLLRIKIQNSINKRNGADSMTHVLAILNLEQQIYKMQGIIINDIQAKNHKWRYLCQSICKSLDIEQDIVQEIQNIIQFQNIYSQNKINYRKNIAFNALSFFYYAQIVFLKRQLEDIQNNLKQLSKDIKYNFHNNQKELENNIFNDKCCLIQFQLSVIKQKQKQENRSQNVQLFISNCNKNTSLVFQIDKNDFITKTIESLFPQFLWPAMQKYLSNYFTEIKNDSQVCNHYFINSQGYVFEGLSNFKLITKNNSVSCVLFIFQKQTKKIVLLNKKKMIENFGEAFLENFRNEGQKIPFSCLFYSHQEYQQLKFRQNQQKRRYFLLNSNFFGKDWQEYLKNISQYLKHQQVMTASYLKDQEVCELPEAKIQFSHRFYEFLKRQKKKLLKSKKINISLQSISSKQQNQFLLQVLLTYKRCLINDEIFYAITFEQIENKLSSKRSCQSQNDTMKKSLNYRNSDQNAFFTKLQKNQKKKCIKNDYQSFPYNQEDQNIQVIEQDRNSQKFDPFVEDQQSFLNSNQKMKGQNQNFIVSTNSACSSLRTQDLLLINNSFIEICYKLFKNPNQIHDLRLKVFTFNSILISVLFSILMAGTYIVFSLNLLEVRDIFFADGAVSDNMQLTEFMYNRAINFKLFKSDSNQFESITKSALFQREYLYNLIAHDHQNYLSAITSMTKTRFYQYLRVPVVWIHDDIKQTPVQIQSNQFLILYYKLSRDVEIHIESEEHQQKKIVKNALNLMKVNFPQLKKINHQNLYLYQFMSDQSLELMKKLLVFVFLLHIMLSSLLFFLFYREKIFRRTQQIDGYSIYKIIPRKVIEIISNYFQIHAEQSRSHKDLEKYQKNFEVFELNFSGNDQKIFYKANTSKFVTNNFRSPLAIWKMFFTLLAINLIYGVIILRISNLLSPIKLMMDNVNNLMDSQNYLLEAYFDLKAKFIIDQAQDMRLSSQFFDSLLQSQLSNDVLFNKIAVQSLTLFSNYDQSYTQEFIDLLISDICQIGKAQIHQQQYTKCKTYFKVNFNSDGVSMGMNFFTRKVRDTINQFKQEFNQLASKGTTNYQALSLKFRELIKTDDFRQIDESIFYMFKLYQATQARIYKSLQTTINNQMNQCLILLLIELSMIGIIFPIVIFLNYHREKIELSKLYVSFLLIPTPVSKLIRSFSVKIQQILEYNQN